MESIPLLEDINNFESTRWSDKNLEKKRSPKSLSQTGTLVLNGKETIVNVDLGVTVGMTGEMV